MSCKRIKSSNKKNKTLKEALALMETMMINSGKPVHADENAMDAFVEAKYKL